MTLLPECYGKVRSINVLYMGTTIASCRQQSKALKCSYVKVVFERSCNMNHTWLRRSFFHQIRREIDTLRQPMTKIVSSTRGTWKF